MQRHALVSSLILATAFAANTFAASAPAEEWQPARFYVFAGAHLIAMDTNTQVSSSTAGRGTELDVERDLGLDDNDTAIVFGARWQPAKRYTIGISHLSLDRDGDAVLTRELQIGDKTFTAAADTETIYDYEMTHLDFRFAIYQTDALDLGVAVGLSRIEFDFEVTAAMAAANGGTLEAREADDFLIPSLGLGLQYRFSPDWYVRMGATYFVYGDSGGDASMIIAGVVVEYFPWKHVGFGIGYDYVGIVYDEHGDDQFDTDFTYQGVLFRLVGRF